MENNSFRQSVWWKRPRCKWGMPSGLFSRNAAKRSPLYSIRESFSTYKWLWPPHCKTVLAIRKVLPWFVVPNSKQSTSRSKRLASTFTCWLQWPTLPIACFLRAVLGIRAPTPTPTRSSRTLLSTLRTTWPGSLSTSSASFCHRYACTWLRLASKKCSPWIRSSSLDST